MDSDINDMERRQSDEVNSQESSEDQRFSENIDLQIASELFSETVNCSRDLESACLDQVSDIDDVDTSFPEQPDTHIENQVSSCPIPDANQQPSGIARPLILNIECRQPTENVDDVIHTKAKSYDWLLPDGTQTEFLYQGQVIPCDARSLKKTKFLGEGKFGIVHEATIESHPEFVFAVKDMGLVDKEEHETVVRSEYECGKQLATGACPYVVRHFGAVRDTHSHSLVICLERMEMAVKSCYEILHEFRQYQPHDFECFLFRLIHDICQALHYFEEKNYIHGDIKPDNMLVDAQGIFKLTDLGSCRRINEIYEGCNNLCGTISYFSPELFDTHRATLQSDMWALGISLLEVINGKTLYSNLSEFELCLMVRYPTIVIPKDKVDSPIVEILEKLLMKNPVDRPKSYAEILNMPCIQDLPKEPNCDEREFISRIIAWQKKD